MDLVQARGMVDKFRMRAKGGDGGNGCVSLRRSRSNRQGMPDGERPHPSVLPLLSQLYKHSGEVGSGCGISIGDQYVSVPFTIYNYNFPN